VTGAVRGIETRFRRDACGRCVLHRDDLRLTLFNNKEVLKMSSEPEGWHMEPTAPTWDPEAKTFSFFLRKRGRESVLCIVVMDALENAVQSSDLAEPALTRIFDAHRQLIELRAAQKLNAGLLESDGSVLVSVNDI
jgi:Protein of unknown function (DUF1488)